MNAKQEIEARMAKLAKTVDRLLKAGKFEEAFPLAVEWHRMAGH